ncbi:hypothetical protein E6H12_04415 [Candidatus Bathyarchaeota archaeon]|nr:MAG: hypothetical protein E6H12_04415 [Candidatus Bathyarchaeota archaeon]
MRSDTIETFQGTLVQCFSLTLEILFGRPVKEQLMRILAEHKIPRSEIGARFDDVAKVLTDVFGSSSRLLVYKTVVGLYEEYSVRANFGFYDSLREQLLFLRERVLSDILKPRHSPSIDDSIYITGHIQDD